MDKRFFLALALSAIVIVLTQLIFPQPKRQPVAPESGVMDTVGRGTARADSSAGAAVAGVAPAPAATQGAAPAPASPATPTTADSTTTTRPAAAPARALRVPAGSATYAISTLGAAPVSAVLSEYRPLLKGGRKADEHVELARSGEPLLRYRLAVAGDTIPLDRTAFTVTDSAALSTVGRPLTLQAEVATRGGQPGRVTISYAFTPNGYVGTVNGRVEGLTGPAYLLLDLPQGLRSQEADTLDDQRHLAFALKPLRDNATSFEFADLEPGERQVVKGPFTWAVAKNKYFLIGVLAPEGDDRFVEATLVGGPRTAKVATSATATLVQPLEQGAFGFELYAGPQAYRPLHALGREFENANPHGWFLQGILQPLSTLVIRLLLWMHATLNLSYGWVLVIFAIVVRLALWPLNQSAMRSSFKMQRLQPELQAVQERYRSDPQKLQQEMMKVYRDHGMSPLSPLMGCLPALIPMPVLLTLIFVFQNTIEFRGVPFLWLNDMSAKDPFSIAPLLMGATTFLLSWIGMRNVPPNPQTKMMLYMLPVMMTMFLVNLAGGLNLYYVVQNLAALPQQWLIANERAKNPPPVVQGTPVKKARPAKA